MRKVTFALEMKISPKPSLYTSIVFTWEILSNNISLIILIGPLSLRITSSAFVIFFMNLEFGRLLKPFENNKVPSPDDYTMGVPEIFLKIHEERYPGHFHLNGGINKTVNETYITLIAKKG